MRPCASAIRCSSTSTACRCSWSAQGRSPPARSPVSPPPGPRSGWSRRDVWPTLDRDLVDELHQRPYEPGDLDGVRLVVTATGDADVDAAVAADATAAGHLGQRRRSAGRLHVHPAGGRPQRPAHRRREHRRRAARRSLGGCATGRRHAHRRGGALGRRARPRRADVRAVGGSTEDVDWSELIDPVVPPPPGLHSPT